MKWRTAAQKVKHSLGRAYETSQKVLSVTDRAHALLAKGYNVVQDRLEPDVWQSVGGALNAYAQRRGQIANVDSNLREIGATLRQSFPEEGGPEETQGDPAQQREADHLQQPPALLQ